MRKRLVRVLLKEIHEFRVILMGNLHGVFLNLIFKLFREMAEKALFDAAQSALFLLSVKAQIHTHILYGLQTFVSMLRFYTSNRQRK